MKTASSNIALGFDSASNVTTADKVMCVGANVGGENVSNITWIGNILGGVARRIERSIPMGYAKVKCCILVVTSIAILNASLQVYAQEKSRDNPPQAAANLTGADQQLRTTMFSNIITAAKKARLEIDTKRIVYVSSGTAILVNAGIAGIEKLDAQDLQKGAKVLLVYLSLPKGATLKDTNFSVYPGYYTVKLTTDSLAKSKAKVQLIDLNEKVVGEGLTEIGPRVAMASVSGGFGGGCVWVDLETECCGTFTITWCWPESSL
jgi:hypothetical protein